MTSSVTLRSIICATLPVSPNGQISGLHQTYDVISDLEVDTLRYIAFDLEVKFYDPIGEFMCGATQWRLNFENGSSSFWDLRGGGKSSPLTSDVTRQTPTGRGLTRHWLRWGGGTKSVPLVNFLNSSKTKTASDLKLSIRSRAGINFTSPVRNLVDFA